MRAQDRPVLHLGDGIGITLAAGSPIAETARWSPSEALRMLVEAAMKGRSRGTPFSDWLERAVVHDQLAERTDRDAMFVSYWQFCQALRVRPIDQLTHAEFCKALVTAGIAMECDELGRILGVGVALRDLDLAGYNRAIETVEALDLFLAECALAYGPAASPWTRARDLQAAYAEWAISTGSKHLTAKRLAGALVARGIAKRSSNGVLYQVTLRPPAPPCGT